MDRDILYNSINLILPKMTLNEFAHLFINEAQAIEDFYKLTLGIKTGNTISLLFNPHRLATDNEKDDLSVFESLQDSNKLSGLARLYLYNLEHGVSNALYSAIQRGYQNIQYINEFPPFVARELYLKYGKCGLNVLDPCAGWGGRMIGCASIANSTYTACEPCTETYEGLLKLGEWLKTLQPSFNYTIYNKPYEDAQIQGKFDIALTSPPYFNTEHYSDEPTNSMNKFPEFDMWIEGFYKPLILNTVNSLKDGAVFILNVGDRKYPLSENMVDICKANGIYCERIHDYLSGNGEGKEKFYVLSKEPTCIKTNKLF